MALTLQGSLSFPVLKAGDDISAEQVAALRSGQVPGMDQSSTTGATEAMTSTTVDEDTSASTSEMGTKSRASSGTLDAFWLAALFSSLVT